MVIISTTLVLSAISLDVVNQRELAAESSLVQESANGDINDHHKNDSVQEKKKFIAWVKNCHILDYRFLEPHPEKINPPEWDEACEKNIYSMVIASLWNENIHDDDIRYFQRCPDIGLIALNTDTTKLSAKGLQQLKGLAKLKIVDFSGKQPVPAGWVESLASFNRIEDWTFDAPVTDDTLLALAGSQSTIKDLSLFNATPLTMKGYRVIGSLSELRTLLIMCVKLDDSKVGIQLSDEVVNKIARCPNLRELHISLRGGGVDFSIQAAKDLASMPKLQCVTMDCFSAPSEEALAILGKRKWISIGLDWPELSAKAKKEDKSPYDMSRKLIEEAGLYRILCQEPIGTPLALIGWQSVLVQDCEVV